MKYLYFTLSHSPGEPHTLISCCKLGTIRNHDASPFGDAFLQALELQALQMNASGILVILDSLCVSLGVTLFVKPSGFHPCSRACLGPQLANLETNPP